MSKAITAIIIILVIAGLGYAGYWYYTNNLVHSNDNNGDNNNGNGTAADTCVSQSGFSMDWQEAQSIAEQSECAQSGALKDTKVCNEITATWWIDLTPNAPQENCNPACVVSLENKTAEINWRCTGLILP